MEENVYKQTFQLDEEEDDGDSDSSEEVQYIQATDLPKDELERILAAYKSSLKPKTDQQIESPEDSDEGTGGEEEFIEQICSTDSAPWLKVLYDDDDDDDDDNDEQEDPEYDSKEKRIKRFKEKHKTSKDQKSSTEIVHDEDTNEEPKVKTIVYKTTYRTSSEQHSSSEESYEEELNEEPDDEDTGYTTYKTTRERASSPEVPLDDDDEDPDYEPKEKRIKRYKTKLKMFREQKLFLEERERKSYKTINTTYRDKLSSKVFENYTGEDPKTANIRKLKKSSIELQPTPGAEYIEIPIPHCNQQKFKQAYRPEWEKEPYLKDWIQPWLADSMYAYCKFCKCKLIAHKKSLRDHSNTKKHRKNAFDITGIWGGSNSKPANLTFLMPRARRKTGDILLNNYDSSSLNFANSSDFNMRVINDPLLPIS